MADYKFIADNDPGSDLDLAFLSMSIETVTSNPEKLMTYRSIANEVGYAESVELENGTAALAKWVNSDLQGRGIDINSPQTAELLGSGIVSNETATKLLAAGVVSSPKFPGLKKGHLQNARQMRVAGEI